MRRGGNKKERLGRADADPAVARMKSSYGSCPGQAMGIKTLKDPIHSWGLFTLNQARKFGPKSFGASPSLPIFPPLWFWMGNDLIQQVKEAPTEQRLWEGGSSPSWLVPIPKSYLPAIKAGARVPSGCQRGAERGRQQGSGFKNHQSSQPFGNIKKKSKGFPPPCTPTPRNLCPGPSLSPSRAGKQQKKKDLEQLQPVLFAFVLRFGDEAAEGSALLLQLADVAALAHQQALVALLQLVQEQDLLPDEELVQQLEIRLQFLDLQLHLVLQGKGRGMKRV